SAAVSISNRSAKAAETAKAAPLVPAITATSVAAWRGRGGGATTTRICAASTAVSPGSGSPAIVPHTNASVAAKPSRSAARCCALSGDIGQHRDQADPEPGKRIRDRVFARVEDDAGACVVAHAAWWPIGDFERQLHWKALRGRQPSAAALAGLRQAGGGIHIPFADAPTDTLYLRRHHAAGQHVKYNLRPRSRRAVLQAVLAHEGLQPHQSRVQ